MSAYEKIAHVLVDPRDEVAFKEGGQLSMLLLPMLSAIRPSKSDMPKDAYLRKVGEKYKTYLATMKALHKHKRKPVEMQDVRYIEQLQTQLYQLGVMYDQQVRTEIYEVEATQFVSMMFLEDQNKVNERNRNAS